MENGRTHIHFYVDSKQTHTHGGENNNYVMVKCTNDTCYSPDQSIR